MRSISILAAILFSSIAATSAVPNADAVTLEARKNGNSTRQASGAQKACAEMRKLTVLTNFAANQSKLDELVAAQKLDAQQVTTLKANAAEAETKLKAMASNSTLTTECAAINAMRQTANECKSLKKLSKMANLAGNQTAMDAFVASHKLNSTQVDKLKERAQKADTKFKALSGNSTLTDICANMTKEKGTSSGTTASGSTGQAAGEATSPEVVKNGAGSLTLSSVSYVVLPALAGVFTFLL